MGPQSDQGGLLLLSSRPSLLEFLCFLSAASSQLLFSIYLQLSPVFTISIMFSQFFVSCLLLVIAAQPIAGLSPPPVKPIAARATDADATVTPASSTVVASTTGGSVTTSAYIHVLFSCFVHQETY